MINYLKQIKNKYPLAWQQADDFRKSNGDDLPKWPSYCYLPIAGWIAIASGGGNVDFAHSLAASRLAALGAWRLTKGIYQFDSTIFEQLTDTPFSGEIPAEVLLRLPQWGVYLLTPGLKFGNSEMQGVFVHLEFDVNNNTKELRLLIDIDQNLVAIPVHLGKWTITEAIDRMSKVASNNSALKGFDFKNSDEDIIQIAQDINPIISLVLYICSSEPEYFGSPPQRIRPKKTKKGYKFFEPHQPTVFKIGEETGAKIREFSKDQGGTHKSHKPHIRRAHWHGFWKGKRNTSEQRFVYKWIPPIFVSVDK